MRPFKPADAIRAIEITSRYPRVHGAPVHVGRPDLTPQSVVLEARPSLCITHAPGHMLVTDLMNASLVSP